MSAREHLVLYVDDEHANRVVFEVTFGKKFNVACVASAEEALALLRTREVAAIVTDQRMPGMSGDELLRRVKELSPDTTRMIVTAYSDLDPILKAVNEGLVARYVIKPWDRTELEETLAWALEAYVVGKHNGALQLRLIQTERLRTLGQVAAAVFHDLAQPVMAVSMSAEQLEDLATVGPTLQRLARGDGPPVTLTPTERQRLGRLAEDLPELASNLASCAAFMSDLMRQLKDFQRHDAGPPASGDIAPVPVIELALTMCRSGTMGAASKLAYEGPPDLPRVRATSTDLLQILLNLVRNAQQALDEHHVHGGSVLVHASAGGGFVTFEVRDDGPGIPADILAKLGTPFCTTRETGTGLGVAQCKRIVGRLGGEVDIDSAPGMGTRVVFSLPLASTT